MAVGPCGPFQLSMSAENRTRGWLSRLRVNPRSLFQIIEVPVTLSLVTWALRDSVWALEMAFAANAFTFSRFRGKNLRPFLSPIDESPESPAVHNNNKYFPQFVGRLLSVIKQFSNIPFTIELFQLFEKNKNEWKCSCSNAQNHLMRVLTWLN